LPANKSVQQILVSKAWNLEKDSKTDFRFVFTRDSMEFYKHK